MVRLNKKVSFNVSGKDKKALQIKAEEMGIPLAQLIRNMVLDKYKNLQVGYISYSSATPMKHDIDIKRLRPPGKSKPMTKEQVSFKECVNELKEVFSKGLNVLGKLEDSELGIKSEEDLKKSEIEAIVRFFSSLFLQFPSKCDGVLLWCGGWDSHPNLPVKYYFFARRGMGIASLVSGEISLKNPHF